MKPLHEEQAHPLIAVHRRWAMYALQQLALHDLSLTPTLFEKGLKFLVVIGNVGTRLVEIAAHFDHDIRPASADVSVVESAPPEFTQVPVATTIQEDMWSTYSPLSVSHTNQMLALISGQVPRGGIDYLRETRRWQFRHFGIDDAGRQAVRDACVTLGIQDEIEFVEQTAPPSPEQKAPQMARDAFEVGTRHAVPSTSHKIRLLVERDEDTWRTFIAKRGDKNVLAERACSTPHRFACLYDTRDESPVQLAELLTLYDVVNIVPGEDLTWMSRHRLTLSELEVMAASGRVRLVLPASMSRYPESVILAATAQSDDGVVLSRDLAMHVVRNGERKDPLLYGPFSTGERTAVLRLLHQSATQEAFKVLVSTYSSSLTQHGLEYAVRGANAAYRIGFGAFLGEVLYRLRGIDARLEMSVVGAAMEWSMGLGAAYVPRQMGGFDETHNASIIASHVSRSRHIPQEPLANRMHTVVDGLLAVTDIPPIEVAKNFGSSSVSRFRQVAMGLVSGPANGDELRSLVAKLNDEVRAFERRRNFLVKWQADTVAMSLVTKLATDALDAKFGSWTSWFASVGAGYLYSAVKNSRAFAAASEVSQELVDTFVGLTLAPSNDAVVMWRARENLRK
ncbi:hypothetical protein [Burkholderia pseudomallei]|uniref:hypothetical protein n=1 Tax=Burkholderia pseudomallei TaxID=28450 RepID=UPI000ABC5F95|nr:hypothetical protein [Burkholderia pseudomallei]